MFIKSMRCSKIITMHKPVSKVVAAILPSVNHYSLRHILPANLPRQIGHIKIFFHHLIGPTQLLHYHMNSKKCIVVDYY